MKDPRLELVFSAYEDAITYGFTDGISKIFILRLIDMILHCEFAQDTEASYFCKFGFFIIQHASLFFSTHLL